MNHRAHQRGQNQEPDAGRPAPSSSPVARLEVVQSTGSTNTDLMIRARADPAAWPHMSVLVAREQTAGKGRAGRNWQSAQLSSLTFSVLVRPEAERSRWGWIPIVAGLAVVRALAGCGAVRDRIGLKWPNDVVDSGAGEQDLPGWGRMRKLGGILTEVLPHADGAVTGIGLNLAGTDLPVPHAGTLAGSGLMPADVQSEAEMHRWADALREAITAELPPLLTDLSNDVEGLRRQAQRECLTIGAAIEVHLPSGTSMSGVAQELAPDGGLLVKTASGTQVVHAGDVRHLRRPQ